MLCADSIIFRGAIYNILNGNQSIMALQLENIPLILQLLVNKSVLTPEQQQQAMDIATKEKLFAGQAAVKAGFTTQEVLDGTLLEQAEQKAAAALKDFQTIAQAGGQDPGELKACWGNNGVNPAAANPSLADGASAAANIAQNIVLLANYKPELSQNAAVKEAVEAASALTQFLAGKMPLGKTEAKELSQKLLSGLGEATKGLVLKDCLGQPVEAQAFIDARGKELEGGIERRFAQAKDKFPSPGDTAPGQGRA